MSHGAAFGARLTCAHCRICGNPDSSPAHVLQRERQRDLERAVAGLSTKLRDVVVLRFCAELNYDEIAETLDIPMGTVKRRLFDAMAKLREELEEP